MPFSIELSDLNGSNGFSFGGTIRLGKLGYSVSDAGDVNGDGFDDVVIGAPFVDAKGYFTAGECYVVFGKAGDFAANFGPADLDGSNGVVMNGAYDSDRLGRSVSGAGDVNGDGFDDIILGAPLADHYGKFSAGESYVVFGNSNGLGTLFDVATLDGGNGFIVFGIDTADYSGISVSAADDINGDGYDDLIIGATGGDPNGKFSAGESYVVFGKAGGFDAVLNLSALDGTNGFVINGIDPRDASGTSVSSAGDVNGDGFDDLIVGAPRAYSNYYDAYRGESYVVFGKAGGFAAKFNLSALNGTNGFAIIGIDMSDGSGASVSSAGDVNGDGFDDVIIGAPGADPNGQSLAGECYVIFGKSGGFGASIDLSTLDGSNGFIISGIDSKDIAGSSVSSAGDVNGDGFDDLLIGAHYGSTGYGTYVGKTYIVFGKAGGFDANLDLASLDGTNGLWLKGIDDGDGTRESASGAGDVNGDGFDDVIIGVPFADPDGTYNAGETFVVFGRASFIPPTSHGDRLIGADGPNDSISGLGGNDTIMGRGGDDTLYGGSGDDIAQGGQGRDSINGHDGNDTLVGNQNADTLRGQSRDDALFGNDGADRLVGDAGDDTMTGGDGADRFVFRAEQTTDGVIDHDVITDYDPLKDKIELKVGVAVEDHDIIAGNLVLTLTGGDQVELQGITNFADVVFV